MSVQMGKLSMSHTPVTAQGNAQSYNSLFFAGSGYSMSGSNTKLEVCGSSPALAPRSPAAHLALALVAGCFHREAIHLANLAKD